MPKPGTIMAEATLFQGAYLRDVTKRNMDSRSFRTFDPDETASNRWGAAFGVTDRTSVAERYESDENAPPDDPSGKLAVRNFKQYVRQEYMKIAGLPEEGKARPGTSSAAK